VLSSLSNALHPVGGAVAAIVILTIVVRLALHPLTRAAVRGERARAALAPRIADLRKRHSRDIVRLSRETEALYRAERVSPYAGFLPLLVQAPVVYVLYRAFLHPGGTLSGAHLFGVSLHAHLLGSLGNLGALLVFAGLLGALAALAWANSRRAAMLMRVSGVAAATGSLAAVGRIAPYFLLVSGVVLPLAAGIYLVTTTVWSLGENTLLRRGLP
jgi:YidC/Oxa1 family membrane protein insertase